MACEWDDEDAFLLDVLFDDDPFMRAVFTDDDLDVQVAL